MVFGIFFKVNVWIFGAVLGFFNCFGVFCFFFRGVFGFLGCLQGFFVRFFGRFEVFFVGLFEVFVGLVGWLILGFLAFFCRAGF